MARWRLINPHYLKVPGNEWEHKETDRSTGKTARKTIEVPQLLDPRDPVDCNYPGELIVCHEGKGQRQDIIFLGDPTPDMEPLDDEAKAISASFADRWKHPIEQMPGEYSTSLISALEKQMQAILANKPTEALPSASIKPEDFAALQAQVAQLMARNAELEAAPKARRA